MTIKLIYSIISLILVIMCPIAFFMYEKKVNGISFKFWDVIIGIVAEFLCKHVLVSLVISILSQITFIYDILTNTVVYITLYVLLTALAVMLGLLLVNKFYYHDKLNKNNVCGLTVGMTIADIINTTLMAAISNLLYIQQISNGTLYDNLVKSVTADVANNVIDTYTAMPNGYFIYVGIITVAMLTSNFLVCTLFNSLKSNKIMRFIYPFIMIAIFTTVYYFTDPTKVSYANVVLIIFSIVQMVFAQINLKEN